MRTAGRQHRHFHKQSGIPRVKVSRHSSVLYITKNTRRTLNRTKRLSNLWQIFDVISIKKQFLKTSRIALDVVWHSLKSLMPLINVLYVPITTLPERDTSQHGDRFTSLLSNNNLASPNYPHKTIFTNFSPLTAPNKTKHYSLPVVSTSRNVT